VKQRLKRLLPGWVKRLYNRTVSKTIIRNKFGSWLDIEWNRNARERSDREWVAAYNTSWKYWQESDLAPGDVERIRNEIRNCSSLLDAGCGDGFLLERVRDLAVSCAGMDLSLSGLKLARKRLGDDQPLVQSFLEALPFPSRCFDTVVTTHTLEHVKDLQRAVSELKRVTARKLIVLVPCQEEVLYSEDYHLHYFSKEADLLNLFSLPNARCVRYIVPPGECSYAGDVLLLTAETD